MGVRCSLLSSMSIPRQRVREMREGREREGMRSSETSSGTQPRETRTELLEAVIKAVQ